MSKVIADISMSLDGYVTLTEGVADAIDQARSAAGDKDVVVMGGANVIDQSLAARLVDELCIHLSPLVLGDGTRLFDLVGPTRLVRTTRSGCVRRTALPRRSRMRAAYRHGK